MEDLDNESDPDMTEVWPPEPPATREAPAAEPGAVAGGGAESNPSTPSVSPGRDDFGGINGSSSSSSRSGDSSSSSDDSRTSSDSSSSNNSGDLPALVGRPAREREVSGKLPALQRVCMRSQSRGLTMSASYADTLLVYAMRTVEAKKAVEEEAAQIEQGHDSLLEERLEKEREWLEELERRGTLLELWRATPIPKLRDSGKR